MTNLHEDFIREITEQVRPLQTRFALAMWESATTGAEEASQHEKTAKAELMRFWADKARYQTAKRLHEENLDPDPTRSRTITRIYLAAAKAQQDEATIEEIAQLETDAQLRFYNFRAVVDGMPMSDNELDNLLRTSQDSSLVRQAWEASKQIGEEVAGMVKRLAHLRNTAARAQGFRDHFQRSLTLNEIEEAHLLNLFSDLEKATREPYTRLKAQIDRARAAHFDIDITELRPWHFGDRFFQRAPETSELSMDTFFSDHDPVELARTTYGGMGMDVRAILERSDLYPREGKDQHAFCLDIDRQGDVRTLNNIEPSHRWTATLIHELGHAVYNQHIDSKLPWMLRTPPHSLTTEAIALMLEALTYDQVWLRDVLGLAEDEAHQLSTVTAEREHAQLLIFTRWALVMTDFERAFYADPDQNLNDLWWALVEKYQALRRPESRNKPDWAAKYHIALAPVYYHSYELGHLVSAQLRQRIKHEVGGLLGRPEAGRWLIERVFHSGASQDWQKHI
ncbi:MAG: hypothetical protein GTO14_06060, partial [Anaerolineales bacterium]|nr:hypothetical protein [Anaerolineales bacterium]